MVSLYGMRTSYVWFWCCYVCLVVLKGGSAAVEVLPNDQEASLSQSRLEWQRQLDQSKQERQRQLPSSSKSMGGVEFTCPVKLKDEGKDDKNGNDKMSRSKNIDRSKEEEKDEDKKRRSRRQGQHVRVLSSMSSPRHHRWLMGGRSVQRHSSKRHFSKRLSRIRHPRMRQSRKRQSRKRHSRMRHSRMRHSRMRHPRMRHSSKRHSRKRTSDYHKPTPKEPTTPCLTLGEVAIQEGLDILVQALEITGLLDVVLDPHNDLTIFAPTDHAFEQLDENVLEELTSTKTELLAEILLYHVIECTVTTRMLQSLQATPVAVRTLLLDDQDDPETLDLVVSRRRGRAIYVQGDGNEYKVLRDLPRITQPNLKACNGVLHIVNRVILPDLMMMKEEKEAPSPAPASKPTPGRMKVEETPTPVRMSKPTPVRASKPTPSRTKKEEIPTPVRTSKPTPSLTKEDPTSVPTLVPTSFLSSSAVPNPFPTATPTSSAVLTSVPTATPSSSAVPASFPTPIPSTSSAVPTLFPTATPSTAVPSSFPIATPSTSSAIPSSFPTATPPSSATLLTIAGLAASVPELSILVTALQETPDLLSALSDPDGDDLTVFAPVDDAFTALGQPAINYLLANPDVLQLILLYHATPGVVTATEVIALDTFPTALEGQDVEVVLQGDAVFLQGNDNRDAENLPEVVNINNAASNGMVHLLNGVLLPVLPLGATLVVNGFSSLVEALVATNLFDTLNDINDLDDPTTIFTIFAPSNEAIADFVPPTDSADDLSFILLTHVIQGVVVDSATLADELAERPETSLRSMSGASLTLALVNDTVTIQGEGNDPTLSPPGTVFEFDIRGINGVIHAIDKVLLPTFEVVLLPPLEG